MANPIRSQNKKFLYALLGIGLLFVFFHFFNSSWQGSPGLHTFLEALGSLLAFFVGTLALFRHYAGRENIFLMIGMGFLGIGILDGYHAIVTSVPFTTSYSATVPSLILWSGDASRAFLALFMLLSLLVWEKREFAVKTSKMKEGGIYAGVSLLIMASFLFFAFAPLPHVYHFEGILKRPQELLIALFFLAAIIGYYRKGYWKTQSLENCVLLFLISNFMSHVSFMTFSVNPFDMMSTVAHLIKPASYLFVMTGLWINTFQLFQESKKNASNAIANNVSLSAANKNLERSVGLFSRKLEILENQNQEMDNIKKAMLNILEDFKEVQNLEREIQGSRTQNATLSVG